MLEGIAAFWNLFIALIGIVLWLIIYGSFIVIAPLITLILALMRAPFHFSGKRKELQKLLDNYSTVQKIAWKSLQIFDLVKPELDIRLGMILQFRYSHLYALTSIGLSQFRNIEELNSALSDATKKIDDAKEINRRMVNLKSLSLLEDVKNCWFRCLELANSLQTSVNAAIDILTIDRKP